MNGIVQKIIYSPVYILVFYGSIKRNEVDKDKKPHVFQYSVHAGMVPCQKELCKLNAGCAVC